MNIARAVVYPPADDIFNAFHFTPLSKVKVLLLGQDPYHNVHQAHGLQFFGTYRANGDTTITYRIYIRNFTMTVVVIFLIMDILKNGLTREYYFLIQCLQLELIKPIPIKERVGSSLQTQ